jgi:hypothetical protein
MSAARHKILRYSFLVAIVIIIIVSVIGYVTAKTTVTYLPFIRNRDLSVNHSDDNKIQLMNPWYILEVDNDAGINVRTIDGVSIMSGLTYYSDFEGFSEKLGLDNVSVNIKNDSIASIQGTGSNGELISTELTVSRSEPRMDINVKTTYALPTTVKREALIAHFDIPVSKVFLKNRKIETRSFDREYWLGHQGVMFGEGSASSLIYNVKDISSLQLDCVKRLLFINLDFSLDHPLIYIPYQPDGSGKFIDRSANVYIPGETRENHFSIWYGNIPVNIPRIMLVPNGYIAGYIFTEHADGGNIRTHRAAYFGCDTISKISEAVNGFAGHKIPVTKSVFYSDSLRGSHLAISICNDPDSIEYSEFLNQLNSSGMYEICLHTPEPYNSNHEMLNEALKYMSGKYHSNTWIDHGMENGDSNRETFVCDGFDRNSAFYASDTWKEYDIRYFWNCSPEKMHQNVPIKKEIKELLIASALHDLYIRYAFLRRYKADNAFAALYELTKGFSPEHDLNSFQPVKGNSLPTPLYWQNQTSTGDFYSWVTDYVYNGISPDNTEDQMTIEKRQLDSLKNDWGIFINHGYYVRNRSDDYYLIEQDGTLKINPLFDHVLELMAEMRDKGDLDITTVNDLMNYWLLTENISFQYLPDGTVIICNNNDVPVKGLSLAVRSSQVILNGKTPGSRKVGDDTVLWFDISAHEKVTLQIKQ